MIAFTSPFRYLLLRNEKGTPLVIRDSLSIIILTAFFSWPFIVFEQVNFSRPSGFVDRMGSLSSVLAGFYIAALVAIGSFSSSIGDLDNKITNGKILLGGSKGRVLTRREYVSAIFGFLSFMALFIAVLSSFILIISPPLAQAFAKTKLSSRAFDVQILVWLRYTSIILYSSAVSVMIITTFYGLYYLTDRIYAKSAVILPKEKSSDGSTTDTKSGPRL